LSASSIVTSVANAGRDACVTFPGAKIPVSQDPPTHHPHADTMMALELKAVLNDIIVLLITNMLQCHGGASSQFEIMREPRKLFRRLIIMIINILSS